ncbi:MAG: hypothetical protein E7583_00850 [Ruminococcaceae bacterium]|nr:hypothetical protein [Oscillospiraceae bacterium]
MKKLSIIMATVCAIVCLLCVSVSAANEMTVSGAVETTTQSTEFAYKVSFSENTGFNTLGIKLTYPEGFEYVDADASQLIKDNFYLDFAGFSGETYVFHHDAAARTVTFVGAALYNITEVSGDLFEVTFNAPATTGTYDFTLEVVDKAYEDAGNVVAVDKVNGTVTVEEGSTYELGDVNMDGSVDLFDAIAVLQYDAGIVDLSDAAYALGDVNYDDSVDLFDAIAILQYEAGIIEEF